MPPAQPARARRPAAPAAPRSPRPASVAPHRPPGPDAARPPRRRGRSLLGWLVQGLVWGGIALFLLVLFFAWDLPRVDGVPAATRRPSVTLLSSDGAMLATQGDLYGEAVRLRDLPPALPAALMAVEDRRFRSHWGIDPIGLARAALANWRAGEVVQGGSTLTQQLAKNLFLTTERTTRRKVQEALLALWLERRFSKDQLLEIYLNRVYLGAGAYGVDAAARLFFGVPAKRRDALAGGDAGRAAQGALRAQPAHLARPGRGARVGGAGGDGGDQRHHPGPDGGRARPHADPPPASRQAGWFADWALEDLAETFPGNADLVLRRRPDARLQAVVEARLEALLAGPGARAGVTQGAVVVLDAARRGPRHGRRPGLPRQPVQPRHQRPAPARLRLQALRLPGGAGEGVRPEDEVSDAPLTLGGWSPGNGGLEAARRDQLEEPLAQSVNTAAVRVLFRAGGPRAAAEAARRLGLDGRFPNDASIALGTGEVTLLDLTAAYAGFANGGLRVTPFGIAGAQATGAALPLPARRRAAPLAAEDAAAMRRMLEAVVSRGTGRAAAVGGRSVAGKTGTTQDFRDAWFIGFAGPAGGGFAGGSCHRRLAR